MARLTARQKASRKASRSKAQKKFLRTLKFYTLSTLTVLSLGTAAAASWWLVDSGWVEKKMTEAHTAWHGALADAGLDLQHIYIKGRDKTDRKDVLAAIGIHLGDSIFAASPEEARERLEALSTVRRASVERILPDTLYVTLRERMPVAVWQHKGKLQLVDIDGVPLKEAAENYPDLLVMTGDGAPEHVQELFALLKDQPELATDVVAVVRVGDRRWNLKFANGVQVMLPDENEKNALEKLAGMQRSQGILDKAVNVIDLRLSERIFITLPEDDPATAEKLRMPKGEASET